MISHCCRQLGGLIDREKDGRYEPEQYYLQLKGMAVGSRLCFKHRFSKQIIWELVSSQNNPLFLFLQLHFIGVA